MVRSGFRVRRWTVKTRDLREDPEIEMRIVVSPRDFTHQAHEISEWISRWCGVWMRWFKSYVLWRDVEPSPHLQTSRRSETQSPILSFVPGEAIFFGQIFTEHGLEWAGDIFSDVFAHGGLQEALVGPPRRHPPRPESEIQWFQEPGEKVNEIDFEFVNLKLPKSTPEICNGR